MATSGHVKELCQGGLRRKWSIMSPPIEMLFRIESEINTHHLRNQGVCARVQSWKKPGCGAGAGCHILSKGVGTLSSQLP